MARDRMLDFDSLVTVLARIHAQLAERAAKAVNVSLTARNWLIGLVIEQYERRGVDRANYGDRLMDELAKALQARGLKRCDRRELYRYRQFYLAYPQIGEALSPEFGEVLQLPEVAQVAIVETPTPQSAQKDPETLAVPAQKLLSSLSFSHFCELIQLDEPLKRSFYEFECLRGGWSVRELKRQLASLYFERSGLSRDKKKLAEYTRLEAEPATPALAIRDPYVFEFLGLKAKEVMSESELEDRLLDKLQDFLLELGHGFCFEARQKRLLIGDEHFFVDLVFYHRMLKCHVLIELKVDAFSHEYLGQLNTYLAWFKDNEMTEGDSPPVGILLCTRKNQALVEYALAGMDNKLFVSRYQVELPKREELRRFLEEQVREQASGSRDCRPESD